MDTVFTDTMSGISHDQAYPNFPSEQSPVHTQDEELRPFLAEEARRRQHLTQAAGIQQPTKVSEAARDEPHEHYGFGD